MKRRIPIWLLRDVPALLAVMATFWPLMILVILNGWRVMSGKPLGARFAARLPILLIRAEARLDHALWRQAFRACGYSARCAELAAISHPATTAEALVRFQSYSRAFQDMDTVARAYAADLRRRYGVHAAQGSTDAALRAAAHPEGSVYGSRFTLTVSRPRSGRPSNHAGEPRANARAPPHVREPPIADCRLPIASNAPRLRTRPHA